MNLEVFFSMKSKICCVTGHRPNKFPWDYYDKENESHKEYLIELKSKIENYIVMENVKLFVCGGALGADMDFAECVLSFKRQYPDIQLEIAIPCPNQSLKWSERDKIRYQNILERADKTTLVSDRYSYFCMQKRNRYMVDKSDFVLAIWTPHHKKGGTYSTLRYAERLKNKEVDILDLNFLLPETKRVKKLLLNYFSKLKKQENRSNEPNENLDIFF